MSATTPSPSPARDVIGALQEALAGEHSAVYAYALLGARLTEKTRGRAQAGYVAHLIQRDRLAADLRTLGVTPVAAEPAYAPPFRVTTEHDAGRLAALVEDRLCAVYADLVTAAAGARRRAAATRLQECAVRGATWRGRSTGAFPGLAERR